MENTEWLSTKDAAAYLGVSDRTLRNYCDNRMIKHQRLTQRTIRFKKEWLDEYIDQITVNPITQEETENE